MRAGREAAGPEGPAGYQDSAGGRAIRLDPNAPVKRRDAGA
jgi:hypothetical protein